MMESLEVRQMLTAAADGVVLDSPPQAPSDVVVAADTTPPPVAAPTSLQISKTFSTSLILGWTDESASESGTRIERSFDNANWTTIGTVGPDVTSFQDSGLNSTWTYYYRVVAFDFVSEFASDSISGTTSAQQLQLSYSDKGLSGINYNGTTLLDLATSPFDGFSIYDWKYIKWDGTVGRGRGDLGFTDTWDADTHTLSRSYGWWSVNVHYVQDVDRLNLVIDVVNNSTKNTLAGMTIYPFWLQFPDLPLGYVGGEPKLGYNIDGPTVIPADWQNGMLAVANDDVAKPLYVGLLTTPQTAIDHKFIYWVGSTPLWFAAGNWAKFDRPVSPGQHDQYTVSIRFGPSGASAEEIAPDVYASALAQFPFQVNWSDRRPIGAIQLANLQTALTSRKNPRGYFGGTFDVRTKAGKESFRKYLLDSANKSIAVLKGMNAQGMIVWDLEGLQYPKINYVGDPTLLSTLAPEMFYRNAVDAYFKKFTNAGLRVGVTVRGQRARLTAKGWRQTPQANPATMLAKKIAYAHDRWGATLFYVDSNGWGALYEASIFKKLLDTYPDILLIPEHSQTRYAAYTAPYFELRNGDPSTPASNLTAYPGAFSVIYAPGGDMDSHHDQLLAGVRRGDILIFEGWFDDPINAQVKAIYDAVYPPAPL